MLPFRFGPPARQLYGIHHPAEGPHQRSAAVLICNPLGQEAVRTQRMFRVLGERLARAGWHVMRFDYFGTGDSAGDDEAGDVLGWRKDVAAAHNELVKRSRRSEAIWLGARLGGTLAVLAAGDVATPPKHLVLWEPVIDGSDYLAQLADRHLQALTETYSIAPPDILQGPHDREALGFALGAAVRQQLEMLNLATVDLPARCCATVVAPPSDQAARDYADGISQSSRAAALVPFAHRFDWTSEEALNTALVPHDALQVLAAQIEAAA